MLGRHVGLVSPLGARVGVPGRCGAFARAALPTSTCRTTGLLSAVTRSSVRTINVRVFHVPHTRSLSRVTRVLHAAGRGPLAEAARARAAGVWSVVSAVPAAHPLAFGAVLSCLKTAGADLVVQKLLEGKAEIDWRRCGL